MGCHLSAAAGDGSEGASHTFRVYNVDSQGIELNPGKIQVAASDLILYQVSAYRQLVSTQATG